MPNTRRNKPAHEAATKLALIRQRRNVTQQELAEKTGVPLTTIYKIETGQNDNPQIRHLVNLAKSLDVKLEEICEPKWLEWTTLKTSASTPPKPQDFRSWYPGPVTFDSD